MWQPSSTAETLLPPVGDPLLGEPRRQCVSPDVRVVATARETADIDEQIDPTKSVGELGSATAPVTDRQQFTHSPCLPPNSYGRTNPVS